MKRRFSSCFSMTEGVVEQINNNVEYAKNNGYDVEKVKALNSGSIVQILTSIAYSLAIISDYLTRVEITKEGK